MTISRPDNSLNIAAMLLLVEIGVLLLFAPELINAGVVNAGCFHLGSLFRLLEKCFKVNVGIV